MSKIFRIALVGFAAATLVLTFVGSPQRVRGVEKDPSRGGAAGLLSNQSSAGTTTPVNFTRDIRPILSDTCFACHGPDPEKRKAGLRLDVRAEATKKAESGAAAIVPGKPDESELIKRLTTQDADEKMPPAKTHKTISAAQIDTFKRWIEQGAPYQEHWSFVPPKRPALPAVKDEKWARNAIDRFVLARLEKEGLQPSPEADKTTLIRRLYLDLIGLPPKPADVDAFVADKSPDAYEKLVERLLVSNHYGERWGRHWLDAARYADSDGYEKDKPRYIFFYRDWVIGAFNRDLSYNQFLIEQLAGDQLPNATQDQRVATGYLRNAMLNEEGGVDPEQFRMDAMFDRMEAIGKGVLGLTIQCAQCHTHKFDPISQEEYYKVFAFLNNDHEAQPVVYTPSELKKTAELSMQMKAIEQQLQERNPDWQEKLAAWEQSVKDDQPKWTVVALENQGDNSQRYLPQPDGSYLAQGYAPTKVSATFKAIVDAEKVSSLRLEYLTDPNLPCGGPGRSFKGTCALTEFKVETAPLDNPKQRKPVKVVSASADFEDTERELEPNFYDKSKDRRVTGPVKYAIDGDKNTAWGMDAGPGRRNTERKAVFNLEKPIAAEKGKVVLYITLAQNHGGWNSDDLMTNNLGRFRVSVTDAPDVKADPLPKRVRESLAVSRSSRGALQNAEIFSYFRTTVPDWKDANDKIESLWKQWPNGTTTFTLASKNDGRTTHMLSRGDWLKPTREVQPGVPAILNPLPKGAKNDRLTFAKWVTDEKAPTTARVFVNRIWQQYFGLGIVSTSEDFGLQGEAPSHPDLLDWLAVEFMHPSVGDDHAKPWSIKHIHRLIVTSATYRQSSKVTKDLLTRDPYNRLLARGSRFRVEGEIVRDISLAASGLLNEEMGGRSVMPPAPAFLFQPPTSYAPFPWKEETDNEKYRRGIYTYRRRTTPYPVLQTFDVPNGDVSCVRRLRSNSPLQALASLNESIFVECAVGLARKTISEGGNSDESRIAYAFKRVVAREPNQAESKALLALLTKQRDRFNKGELKAEDFLGGAGVDVKELPTGTNANDIAAQAVVARVILNLDEAITRE